MSSFETARDSFSAEARSFVAQWDRLRLPARSSFGDIPDAADVRPMISQAEWMYAQHNNPLRDFTGPERLVIDFAASFLRWLPDPGNPALWDAMFEARVNIEYEYPREYDEYPWEYDSMTTLDADEQTLLRPANTTLNGWPPG